jgi:hypothetical protein
VIVFFGVLAVGTLLILESWQENEVPLRLGPVPEVESALGDAVAVGSAPGVGVAGARVAPVGRTALVAAAAPLGGVDTGDGSSRSAIAPAVVAARPAAPSAPAQAPTPELPAALQPQPAPVPTEPAAVPVSVPASAPAATSPGRGGFEGGVQGPVGAGAGGEDGSGASFEANEGGEYALSFSFEAEPLAYRAPGAENLIVRIGATPEGQPSFGLQLWDDGEGSRGLWSSGEAMAGDRFLAPVADGGDHEVVVDFRASGDGEGFYLVFLDGQPVDGAAGVDLVEAGSGIAQVDVGLFREGEAVQASSDVLFGAAALESLEPSLP